MNANEAQRRLYAIFRPGWTPAQAVEEAVAIYLEMGAEIEALDVARAAAKKVIADVVIKAGKDRFETNVGLAYIANPSLRIGYDDLSKRLVLRAPI